MRETFENLGQLMGMYYLIKLKLEGKASILPKKDFEERTRVLGARISQSAMEDKYCFIGDIEKYVEHYYEKHSINFKIPPDILLNIFHLRFCKEAARYGSYGRLAIEVTKLRKRCEPIPERLQYRNKLHDEGRKMQDGMEDYFVRKGFIIPIGCVKK